MQETIKNINAKKVFIIMTIITYTYLNLHIINNVVSVEYWWLTFMRDGGDMLFMGVVVGLFLNASLVLFYLHKK